jgi:hypothetical protein
MTAHKMTLCPFRDLFPVARVPSVRLRKAKNADFGGASEALLCLKLCGSKLAGGIAHQFAIDEAPLRSKVSR